MVVDVTDTAGEPADGDSACPVTAFEQAARKTTVAPAAATRTTARLKVFLRPRPAMQLVPVKEVSDGLLDGFGLGQFRTPPER